MMFRNGRLNLTRDDAAKIFEAAFADRQIHTAYTGELNAERAADAFMAAAIQLAAGVPVAVKPRAAVKAAA